MISSGRELSIYDRRRDKDRRRVIKGARCTSDNRDKVVSIEKMKIRTVPTWAFRKRKAEKKERKERRKRKVSGE